MAKIRILLIEDDADDIELLRDALELNAVDCEVEVVMEGDKAIPYLEKSAALPDVIVMDFNLPRLHGREVLSQIRNSKFGVIPLMVLTTSASQDDMRYAFSMGANKFITKPNSMQGFNLTVQAIISLVQ